MNRPNVSPKAWESSTAATHETKPSHLLRWIQRRSFVKSHLNTSQWKQLDTGPVVLSHLQVSTAVSAACAKRCYTVTISTVGPVAALHRLHSLDTFLEASDRQWRTHPHTVEDNMSALMSQVTLRSLKKHTGCICAPAERNSPSSIRFPMKAFVFF